MRGCKENLSAHLHRIHVITFLNPPRNGEVAAKPTEGSSALQINHRQIEALGPSALRAPPRSGEDLGLN